MFKIDLNNPINVYFIGIGGISMSGLAKILKFNGFNVSGTDRAPSEQTDDLIEFGIHVNFGHDANNITKDLDLVVYTAAIPSDNPEIKRANELSIPLLNRADLLGEIMENYSESITVSGTHGKTTTTSMISLILMEHADPTVTIGGVLPAIKSNVHIGKSQYFVAEACEYTNSFFSFYPKYNVILNIEEDHPDFFKNLQDIRNSFSHFANNTKAGGTIYINSEIENIDEIAKVPNVSLFTFGLSESSNLTATNIVTSNGTSRFIPVLNGEPLDEVTLNVPGIFNVVNALGAISVCLDIGVPISTVITGLSKFTGAHRRFEYKGSFNGARIYDDYAHHPTECASCLKAAREFNPSRLIVFFQPHTYSRTEALFYDFVDALSIADQVVLFEIYPAREKNINNTSSKQLSDALRKRFIPSEFFANKEDAVKYFQKNLINDDMLIIMGAGDIYLLAENIING